MTDRVVESRGQIPDNPITIEDELRNLITWITQAVTTNHHAYLAKAAADHAYRVAYARAYVAAPGPQQEKRFRADLETIAEAEARDIAEAAHRYALDKHRALRDRLEAVRSIGASVREAYRSAGAM